MKIKSDNTIRIDNLNSALLVALMVADGVWKRLGVPHGCTITSGNEGEPGDGIHSNGSLHYPQNTPDGKGRAVDLRVWDVNKDEAARRLTEYLPDNFDVVVEKHHVHVEYQPE